MCTFISSVGWFAFIASYLVFLASGGSEGGNKLDLFLPFVFLFLLVVFPVVWVGSWVLLTSANAMTPGKPWAFLAVSALEGAVIGIFFHDYLAPLGEILASMVMVSAAGVTIYFNRDKPISSNRQELSDKT